MAMADAMREIEHSKFAVRVGLSNSFRVFLRNISEDPQVANLLTLSKSSEVASAISQRVAELSRLGVDYRYLHLFDIPIATYLWILSRSSPDLARVAAEVTANLPRTWWTDKITHYILEDWSKKSSTSTRTGVIVTGGAHSNTSNVASGMSAFLSPSAGSLSPTGYSGEVKSETGKATTIRPEVATDLPISYTITNSPKRPAEPE